MKINKITTEKIHDDSVIAITIEFKNNIYHRLEINSDDEHNIFAQKLLAFAESIKNDSNLQT